MPILLVCRVGYGSTQRHDGGAQRAKLHSAADHQVGCHSSRRKTSHAGGAMRLISVHSPMRVSRYSTTADAIVTSQLPRAAASCMHDTKV